MNYGIGKRTDSLHSVREEVRMHPLLKYSTLYGVLQIDV